LQERHGCNAANAKFHHDFILTRKTYQLGEFMSTKKIVRLFGSKVLPEVDARFFGEIDMIPSEELGNEGWRREDKSYWKW